MLQIQIRTEIGQCAVVHCILVFHQRIFPFKLMITLCASKSFGTFFQMCLHVAIKIVLPIKSLSTGLTCFERFWLLWFHCSMKFDMPLQISSMGSFKLTQFTFAHNLLCFMLSHVVLKFLHPTVHLTTLSTFKRFVRVHSILVQSQFDSIQKIFSAFIAQKLSPFHFTDLVQLIKTLNHFQATFSLSRGRWTVKSSILAWAKNISCVPQRLTPIHCGFQNLYRRLRGCRRAFKDCWGPLRFARSLRGGVALKKYLRQKTLPSRCTYRIRVRMCKSWNLIISFYIARVNCANLIHL